MAPVLRFAPSPTGLIHIGNARTALLNALVARREGGTFVLRFDDTDVERSRTEYADQTEADLAWLHPGGLLGGMVSRRVADRRHSGAGVPRVGPETGAVAARVVGQPRLPTDQFKLGKFRLTPALMPVGHRAVTVLRRV